MKQANKEITLTSGQRQAFDAFKKWLETDERFKTLKGFAGTGKTTLLDFMVDYAKRDFGEDLNVVVTATTNKAVKVLRDKIDHHDFMTIHSLLNIKPVKKGDKEVFEPVNFDKEDISNYDLIIVDECSMISKKLIGIINEQLDFFNNMKVLYCGDPAQLQPINEEISDTFDFNPMELTEVVRHGNTIANKAKLVRENNSLVDVRQLLDPPTLQYITLKDAEEMFKNFRDDPDYVRVLCWTNNRVNYWNRVFRNADIGKTPMPYTESDIVIANSPCIKETAYGDKIIMHNSEEARVEEVSEEFDSYLLKARTLETGREVHLRVMKNGYKEQYQKDLRGYAAAKNWSAFWSEKNRYHDIRHCYSITTHKSQGSTFDNVIVDARDINKNREILNRNQLLYVAMTRAADNVYFLQ